MCEICLKTAVKTPKRRQLKNRLGYLIISHGSKTSSNLTVEISEQLLSQGQIPVQSQQ